METVIASPDEFPIWSSKHKKIGAAEVGHCHLSWDKVSNEHNSAPERRKACL